MNCQCIFFLFQNHQYFPGKMVDEEMPAAASPVSSTEEAVTLSPKRKLVESPVLDSSGKFAKAAAAPPPLNSLADLTKLKTLADFGYAFNDKEC